MVWTSLVVVATLLALNGDAHVIRNENLDAAPVATPQEDAFSKHWQDELGDVLSKYKKEKLGENTVSVLEQKEKIYNAEFGLDAGNKTEDDTVRGENAKVDGLREEYGEEYVDKKENLLEDDVINGSRVVNGDRVKDLFRAVTPPRLMNKETLDEEALKEEREEDDIVEERQIDGDELEGETPEVYMDKQENTLDEDVFNEEDEEDGIEKEEDVKEDILKEADEEIDGSSDGHKAKDIAKLYAVSPTKEDKPGEETPSANKKNSTETTGFVTRDEKTNEKALNGTSVELTYDDVINDGLFGLEFNRDQVGRKEKEDETVLNDQKKTNDNTTQDKAIETNENEHMDVNDQDIIEFVQLLFDHGIGNSSYFPSEKETEKEKPATSTTDGETLAEDELNTKKTAVNAKENVTSKNEKLDPVGEGIIEIVEFTFGDGVDKPLDQQNEREKGKSKEKEEKAAKAKVEKEPLIGGKLDTKKLAEKTDDKVTTSEIEKSKTDGEDIIEIVQFAFGDGNEKTPDQEDKGSLVDIEAKTKNENVKTDKTNKKSTSKTNVDSTNTQDKETFTSVEEDFGTTTAELTKPKEAATSKTSASQNESVADVEGTNLSGNPAQDLESEMQKDDANTTELSSPVEAADQKQRSNHTTTSEDEITREAVLSNGDSYSEASLHREVREARYPTSWSKTSDSPASGEPHVNVEHISRPGWSANLVTSDGPTKLHSSKSFLAPMPIGQWSPFEAQGSRNIPGYIVNEKVIERSYVRPSALGNLSDIDDLKNLTLNPYEQGLGTGDVPQTPVTSSASQPSQLRNDDAVAEPDQNLEAQASRFYPSSIPNFDEDQQLNPLRPSCLSSPPQLSFPNFPVVPAIIPVPVLYPVLPIPYPFVLPGPVPSPLKPPSPPRHHRPRPCSGSPYDNDNSYPLPPQW